MGLFNRYVFVNDNQAVKDAAHIVAKASREHDETIKGISEAEIKSKDRVDISLKEYEELKRENRALRAKCAQAAAIFEKISIDPRVVDRINLDTVQKYECKNLRDFTTRIRIEFDMYDYGIGDI